MPGHQHLLELKKTYAAYEPYIASISSRRSSASSCRSLSSLSATAQEKLHAALAGLEACTIEALLALCSALDVEGKRTEPDEKVQALVMQASLSMIRVSLSSLARRIEHYADQSECRRQHGRHRQSIRAPRVSAR